MSYYFFQEKKLILSHKLENDVDAVMDWWRPKAIRRYTNLLEQDRIKPEHLYYKEMIDMKWENKKEKDGTITVGVKDKYMPEVGR